MRDPSIGGREPAITLPGLLVAAIASFVALHALRSWLSDATDVRLLLDAGFIPAKWSVALGWGTAEEVVRRAADGDSDPAVAAARQALARYVTADGNAHPWTILSHAFLHGSWTHLGLNCVWLAAFGTPVVRRFGTARSIVLAGLAAAAGALFYWAWNPLGVQIVIGASGVVSGMMGAAAVFVFGGPPEFGLGRRPSARGLEALRAIIGNPRALAFLAAWFAINLLVGLLGAPLGLAEGGIAWEAHVGGLLAGLLAFPLLDPPADRRDRVRLSS